MTGWTRLLVVAMCACVALESRADLSDEQCAQARAGHEAFATNIFRRTIESDSAGALQFALSALWLDERRDQANQRLRDALTDVRGDSPNLTPRLASQSSVKWSMRMWVRIYYLFHDDGVYAGRLDADVQASLRELLWNYACAKSTLARAQPRYIWHIQDSENHDMMDLSNAFLALQAVKGHAAYRERTLPDGHRAREHVEAWTRYYSEYCRQRAAHGLFVEVDSPIYGKWFLPELVNMFDFAEDDELRRRMEMLLHLVWADWSIDQLDGLRGGGKTRAYHGKYAQLGTFDSWRMMGMILIGQGQWIDARSGQANYVLASTRYRLPDVVIELALSGADRGEHVYRSLRPAKMVEVLPADSPPLRDGIWYVLDASDPRLVRYSYCTPEVILGSMWVDPALGTGYRPPVHPDAPSAPSYAAISAQNRWQGAIFASNINARVFVQGLGEDVAAPKPTFNQHLAVQHENVMLLRRHPQARSVEQMRVFFSSGMHKRLVERGEWFFLKEGDAYLAVRIVGEQPPWTWDGANWLCLSDPDSPVALVVGRTAHHATLDDFVAYVLGHEVEMTDGVLRYAFVDRQGRRVELRLAKDGLPEIDGRLIDLRPPWVYDSPFLSGRLGGSVVTIQSHSRRLILDFERNVAEASRIPAIEEN